MKKSIISLLLCFLLFSCASIVGKRNYPVSFNSNPNQAEITITDETGKTVFSGTTPTTITLSTRKGYFKGKNYSVTFKKPGYGPYTAEIRRGVSLWYIAGNAAFGGLIGWLIVDPLTGSMWTLQEDVNGTLTPNDSKSDEKDFETVRIVSLSDVPESLRSRMVQVK